MSLGRRDLMLAGASLGLAVAAGARPSQAKPLGQDGSAPSSSYGLVPGGGKLDQTASLQVAIEQSVFSGTPLFIPPGTYKTGSLRLKSGVSILGVPGQTVLKLSSGSSILQAQAADTIRLSGLTLDAEGAAMAQDGALLAFDHVTRLDIADCRFLNSAQDGVSLRNCAGRVSHNEIGAVRGTGFFSNDAAGLEISHNLVRDCGDNGIQVWRSEIGEDGTLVFANRVERIEAKSGGSGENGNGINLFRAGNVVVSGNRIADCAYSAVRDNSGANCQIIGNSCSRLGETAIFVEFAFDGAIVAQNTVEQAATGISVTNFNDGGHLAVVQGNLIRNIFTRQGSDSPGIGIAVEADCAITGNIVDTAPGFGLAIGWQRYLRDVVATGNLIRNCAIGIGVSVTAGAGKALIADNMITGANNGAIRAMHGADPVGADLATGDAKSYPNLAIASNLGA
jgi:uncharacterized secreted repeat protein (TIGR03808 family)